MPHTGAPGRQASERLFYEDFPVGKSFAFGRLEVSETLIAAYRDAFDPRRDAAAAASPWQVGALLMRLNYDGWMHQAAARGAPGVDELRWIEPVRAGHALTVRASVLNARVSRSRLEIGLVQFRYDAMAEGVGLVLSQTNSVLLSRRAHEAGTLARPGKAPEPQPQPPSSAARAMPAHWTDLAVGQRIALGATDFTAGGIVAFARTYDPQPFHVDEAAARRGPFGALAASGWHTAASWMRAFVDACRGGTVASGRIQSVSGLRWARPVYAGDRIAWDFTPIDVATSADGGAIVTSRNSGVNQDGVTVYDFTMRMAMPRG